METPALFEQPGIGRSVSKTRSARISIANLSLGVKPRERFLFCGAAAMLYESASVMVNDVFKVSPERLHGWVEDYIGAWNIWERLVWYRNRQERWTRLEAVGEICPTRVEVAVAGYSDSDSDVVCGIRVTAHTDSLSRVEIDFCGLKPGVADAGGVAGWVIDWDALQVALWLAHHVSEELEGVDKALVRIRDYCARFSNVLGVTIPEWVMPARVALLEAERARAAADGGPACTPAERDAMATQERRDRTGCQKARRDRSCNPATIPHVEKALRALLECKNIDSLSELAKKDGPDVRTIRRHALAAMDLFARDDQEALATRLKKMGEWEKIQKKKPPMQLTR